MSQATLIVELPDGTVNDVDLGEETSIGRALNNDVVLADGSISRRHALIRAQQDEHVLIDLGSENGTYLNGRPLTLPCRLNDGDRVGIGPMMLTFIRVPAELRSEGGGQSEDTINNLLEHAKREVTLLGAGAAMTEVFLLLERAASSPIPVLIEGETGTGKELIARGIHRASRRSGGPFVAVNCAALPETLLESELFGHRKGAFTGATHDRRGLVEAASSGSLFLDEVGEMPATMQPKLLRVLQEGEVTPLGDTRPSKIDVRVISATNRDLAAEIARGSFRSDLYYRIAGMTIRVPALRDRREDIPLIAERLLAVSARRHGKRIRGIELAALDALLRYDWPGNVRELQNELDRDVAFAREGEAIGVKHLSSRVVGLAERPSGVPPRQAQGTPATPPGGVRDADPATQLRDARSAFEARYIAEMLAKQGGNVARTARALGISKVGLYKKIKEHGLG